MRIVSLLMIALVIALAGGGCAGAARRPDAAPSSSRSDAQPIDRFSDAAGHDAAAQRGPKPPGPDQPIDCDRAPFITQSRGPAARSSATTTSTCARRRPRRCTSSTRTAPRRRSPARTRSST